jgi:hypothetical protein
VNFGIADQKHAVARVIQLTAPDITSALIQAHLKYSRIVRHGGTKRPPSLVHLDRPKAVLAIVAERQHPRIDDLQLSSSPVLTASAVELNSTIPGTALYALWQNYER